MASIPGKPAFPQHHANRRPGKQPKQPKHTPSPVRVHNFTGLGIYVVSMSCTCGWSHTVSFAYDPHTRGNVDTAAAQATDRIKELYSRHDF